MRDPVHSIAVGCPSWTRDVVDWQAVYATDEERMRLAIELARQNVLRGTGGPFGAAIVEVPSGRLLAVGVNRVIPSNNSTLHAEILAIVLAQQRVGSYTLSGRGDRHCEIVSSCDPCAMCLGAVLWSGVRRLVTGAGRDAAAALGFDEGPVFQGSYAYLEARGVAIRPAY
jgi:tRNA(Arg) A34 adenosine deaminase TadA